VALQRGIDGSDPVRPLGRLSGSEELRRVGRSSRLAGGTLACPACDAPVSPGPRALTPTDFIGCPFCYHGGVVRDFLSLRTPGRPARVDIRVVSRP
jgi:hypothetical protein